MRGAEHRARIRETLAALAEVREHLVFLGGCTLGLYGSATGSAIRLTEDVDCFSTLTPWILQEQILGRLCSEGVLVPDAKQSQRYRVRATGLVIDMMSPDGMNVPASKWLRAAADNAGLYDLGDGEHVKAVTPPYFVALKLAAFLDRGQDFLSSKDIEDIVFVAAEVPGLIGQIETKGLGVELAELWRRSLAKHRLSEADLRDIVDAHLGREERPRIDEVVETLRKMSGG